MTKDQLCPGKERLKVWVFRAETAQEKYYQTVMWNDFRITCSCKEWVRTNGAKGSKAFCRHTTLVTSGKADQECVSVQVITPFLKEVVVVKEVKVVELVVVKKQDPVVPGTVIEERRVLDRVFSLEDES